MQVGRGKNTAGAVMRMGRSSYAGAVIEVGRGWTGKSLLYNR